MCKTHFLNVSETALPWEGHIIGINWGNLSDQTSYFSRSAHEIQGKHWSWNEDVQDILFECIRNCIAFAINQENPADRTTSSFSSSAHRIQHTHRSRDQDVQNTLFECFGNCVAMLRACHWNKSGRNLSDQTTSSFSSSAHEIWHTLVLGWRCAGHTFWVCQKLHWHDNSILLQ